MRMEPGSPPPATPSPLTAVFTAAAAHVAVPASIPAHPQAHHPILPSWLPLPTSTSESQARLTPDPSLGRLSQDLLLALAEQVHGLEPIEKLTTALPGVSNMGLDAWSPAPDAPPAYDLVWNQWSVGHLTDVQLVACLRRCRAALRDGGLVVVVVEENLSASGADQFDDVDTSVTRSNDEFRALFAEAGLRIVRTEMQRGFPKTLFPVRMCALQRAGRRAGAAAVGLG